MLDVLIALLPAVACSLFFFGAGALVVLLSAVAGCVATEYLIQRFLIKGKSTIGNYSAIVTGVLLALNLPSNLPVYIVILGSIFSIGIVKMAFGGLGNNIFNPAIAGRVFLLLSFPAQMTTWPLPIVNRWKYFDMETGATILSTMKESVSDVNTGASVASSMKDMVEVSAWDAFLGNMGGSMGEVSAIALLIGAAYLLIRKVITWHIPVAILASVALFYLALGDDPLMPMLTGGLLLGAFFMATDYATSPMSHKGMIIYGVMIGVITVIIRKWGAYPEGVSFAILLMNGLTPLINRYFKPTRFGERSKR
jgi:electron transport complex protein RnfD